MEDRDIGHSPPNPSHDEESHTHLHRLAIYCQPELPGLTKPAQDFLIAGHETMHFVGSFFGLARKMDQTLDDLSPAIELLGENRDSLMKYVQAIDPYKDLAFDLLNARIVDIFLCYLSDLFAAIYMNNPEMLKSQNEMKVEEILTHSTMDQLVQSIAERKVNDLAYLGFAKLVQTVEKQMGLALVPDSDVYQKMLFAIEFRNLFVHNHGIVNKIFKDRVPSATEMIGEKLTSRGRDWAVTIAGAVLDIDKRASTKFSLQPSTVASIPRMCGALGRY